MQSGIGHEAFTTTHTAARHTKGEVVEIVNATGLKKYMYVKYDNGTINTALANGNLVYYLDGTDFDGYTVTIDESDTHATLVAGVAIGVIADASYGWVQVRGYHTAVVTNGDDDIAAGDAIVPSAAGDGTADSTAEGTAPLRTTIGWATAADVDGSNTVATYITLQ